jgi:general secretion pathway protein K
MTGARRRQRGVAVVVAVLVVALATSTAAALVWEQSLWLRQLENHGDRAQADALARAAASWVAVILAADDPAIDHLGEPWARRLPPFPAERAEVAGTIDDEQGKLNVNNLARDGGASPQDLVAFQRLLTALGLPAGLADAIVDWLDADDEPTGPNGAEDHYYLARDPAHRAANRAVLEIGELARVKGLDDAAVARLARFVTALPEATPVNVNTAPPEVLRAIVPSLTAEGAANVVAARARQPFASREAFLRALPAPPSAPIDAQIDVRSRYFSAAASVRQGRTMAGYRALFARDDRGLPVLVALSQAVL